MTRGAYTSQTLWKHAISSSDDYCQCRWHSWQAQHIDGLMQKRWNSSALAMELLQSCTKLWYIKYTPKIYLTHWGRVMHICVGNLTIISSDNGLSPGRRQAITWTNVGILLIGPLGTNFHEMLIEIHTISFKKIHFKMLSGKRRPFCLGLNVLTQCGLVLPYGISDYGQHCFMKPHSALLAICEWNPVVTGEFPSQKAAEFWCFLSR